MRTWFITGASRGFGALIAAEALTKGDAVVATARDPKSISARFGAHPNLLAVRLDVTQDSQVREVARAAIERFGRIDILVNNAGYGLLGAVEEATAEQVEALYRTNVFGLLAVTRAVLPYMRRQRSGRILNMSSLGGLRGAGGWGIYPAHQARIISSRVIRPSWPRSWSRSRIRRILRSICRSEVMLWRRSRGKSPTLPRWCGRGAPPRYQLTSAKGGRCRVVRSRSWRCRSSSFPSSRRMRVWRPPDRYRLSHP